MEDHWGEPRCVQPGATELERLLHADRVALSVCDLSCCRRGAGDGQVSPARPAMRGKHPTSEELPPQSECTPRESRQATPRSDGQGFPGRPLRKDRHRATNPPCPTETSDLTSGIPGEPSVTSCPRPVPARLNSVASPPVPGDDLFHDVHFARSVAGQLRCAGTEPIPSRWPEPGSPPSSITSTSIWSVL